MGGGAIKPLNYNKLSNIMKSKYCILYEKLLVKNHGGCCCRNFAK